MCQRPEPRFLNCDGTSSAKRFDESYCTREQSPPREIGQFFWPTSLPFPIALALIPILLPQSWYLNRGYTVWFHLMSTAYLLLARRSTFFRKVLILQGIGICVGWYAAMIGDWIADGTVFHTLYRNMPQSMIKHMLVEDPLHPDGYVMLDTFQSYIMRVVSNIIDLILHPGVVFLLWKLHIRAGGSSEDVLSLSAIGVSWLVSRFWSLFHSHHNEGIPSLWYIGRDVYVVKNLDGYVIAYVAEAIFFAVTIALRLRWGRSSLSEKTSGGKLDDVDARPPELVHSESAVSTSSIAR